MNCGRKYNIVDVGAKHTSLILGGPWKLSKHTGILLLNSAFGIWSDFWNKQWPDLTKSKSKLYGIWIRRETNYKSYNQK